MSRYICSRALSFGSQNSLPIRIFFWMQYPSPCAVGRVPSLSLRNKNPKVIKTADTRASVTSARTSPPFSSRYLAKGNILAHARICIFFSCHGASLISPQGHGERKERRPDKRIAARAVR